MKHAYLIIANKNPNQVQLLIDTLDDKRNDVYLLVDQNRIGIILIFLQSTLS